MSPAFVLNVFLSCVSPVKVIMENPFGEVEFAQDDFTGGVVGARFGRREIWTDSETESLVTHYAANKAVLMGASNDASARRRKQEVWEIITRNINLENPQCTHKNVNTVIRKWNNLQCIAKKEINSYKKNFYVTGGAPTIQLKPITLQVYHKILGGDRPDLPVEKIVADTSPFSSPSSSTSSTTLLASAKRTIENQPEKTSVPLKKARAEDYIHEIKKEFHEMQLLGQKRYNNIQRMQFLEICYRFAKQEVEYDESHGLPVRYEWRQKRDSLAAKILMLMDEED